MPCPVEKYATDVVSGQIVAGRLVRLACARHLRDLEQGHKRGLKWDQEAANYAIGFFSLLRLPVDGDLDGMAFELEPFQQFIIGSLFGWKGPDGYRRFRTAYCEIGKGNGKTPMLAGVGLFGMVADNEAAAEIYSAATSQKQATILFNDAVAMIEASPALRSKLTVNVANISYDDMGSFFRPVSSEKRSLDGPRVHMGLIDEIHEHRDAVVIDKIRAGTKRRKQALICEITNSGHDRTSVCWSHHQFSESILEGTADNDSWFAYVCQLDPCEKHRDEGQTQPVEGCKECDDWREESCWLKANPGLDTILPAKYLREQVAEAVSMPAKQSIVKRLNFCVWTEASVHAIPMDKWDTCSCVININRLEGREVFAALDIGSTSDFTALALVFPEDDGEPIEIPIDPRNPDAGKQTITRRSFTLTTYFWMPERSVLRDSRMADVIAGWKTAGNIRVTSGDVVDYDEVLGDILTILQPYSLSRFAVDRGFQGAQICTNLMKHLGDKVEEFPQGIISMNAPFREFIELIIRGKLHHSGNPVARWMASNTVAETRGGLIKPSKDKSSEKIDIITAATMAIGVAIREPAQFVSMYETSGGLSL